MRLFDFLRSQLVDVVDWVEAPSMLASRNPIKGDTRLTARKGTPV